MAVAFIFPGQGSQSVGMGAELAKAFPVAQAVFDEVDDALGEGLSKTIWEGSKDKLTLTENAQPALMAVSMAVHRVLESELGLRLKGHAACVAGHSLGEYSALAAAGALSVGDAARLLRVRGRAMQAAVPVGVGGMVALVGADIDVARAIASEAAQGDVCEVANDNEPIQVVLSGHKSAMERVGEVAKGHGVRRVIPLPVSAPFHCSLMQPAADVMAEALAGITLKVPEVPVVANVLAAPVQEPSEIRSRLIDQVTGTVRWRESVMAMVGLGVNDFYEVGAGKVLAGLVKRIDDGVRATSVSGPDDVQLVKEQLFGGKA